MREMVQVLASSRIFPHAVSFLVLTVTTTTLLELGEAFCFLRLCLLRPDCTKRREKKVKQTAFVPNLWFCYEIHNRTSENPGDEAFL